MSTRRETESALQAVRVGMKLAAERVGASDVYAKAGVDIVTGADIAAEDAMRRVLSELHPELPIVGEERGGEPPSDGSAYWLIDPICGTRNYASRLPLYCTNLALVESGEVMLAAVGDGSCGDLLFAERGHGAYLSSPVAGTPPQRLSARDGSVLGLELATKPPYRSAPGSPELSVVLPALAAGERYIRLLGTTLGFAKVATGELAGLLFLGDWIDAAPDPLHTAAGCLLAEEAGALITDGLGRPWTLDSVTFVIAAAPAAHAELLDLLARARS